MSAVKTDGVGQSTKLRDTGAPAPRLNLSGPIIGIDLGTSNSCVAFAKAGDSKIIESPGGYTTTPSIIHMDTNGSVLVGRPAQERMILEPKRAIYAAKRFLGRPFESKEVSSIAHFFPYELTAGEDGRVAAKIDNQVLPLEVVSGHILAHLKTLATHALGQTVQRAVITIPAYFGETQRQAVRDAALGIGLNVERLINEPTAAAVAYGFGRGLKETVLVYDLGGGTFDASVLKIDGDRTEVLATGGDAFLGGADFDDRLTEYVMTVFERESGLNLRDELVAMQRIRFAVEAAKRQLSELKETEILLPYIAHGNDGPVDLKVKVEREMFESLTQDLVDRTLTIVDEVLTTARLTAAKLDDIILVGGQSRSPAVHRLIQERFGKRPCKNVHPDEAIALGAAFVADAMNDASSSPSLHLSDVLPAAIRLGQDDGASRVLLQRNTVLPAETRFELPLAQNPQEQTRITLYRGEAELAKDNTLVGSMMVPGAAPTESGPQSAIITISMSADGLLTASVKHPTRDDIEEMDVLLL